MKQDLITHLDSRYLNRALHKVWIDNVNNIATFPIWNLSGQLIGYQQYRPEGSKSINNNPKLGRYFTRNPGKGVVAWGLESYYLSNTLYITEGLFDAARITNKGYSCIAVFSNSLGHNLKKWLYIVKTNRPVVALCDGDSAGSSLGNFTHRAIFMPKNKDVSSLDSTEFEDLLDDLKK